MVTMAYEIVFKNGTKIEVMAGATPEEVDRQISMARSQDSFMVFELEDRVSYVRADEIVAFSTKKPEKVKFGAKKKEE